MSGTSGDRLTVNSRDQFSCSERTPTMKKLPRPTASSTIRAWLPGRLSCSTAWRSGNQRACASGAIARDQRDARRGAARAPSPAKPTATTAPTRSEPACQIGERRPARRPRRRVDADLHRDRSRRVAASARSSSDGLTCRMSSSGTSENSTDTSRPMPNPCSDGGTGQRVVDDDARRRGGGQRRTESHAMASAASSTPKALPARPSAITCAM